MSSENHAVLTDKALAQTQRAGGRYAVIPWPWLCDWMDLVADTQVSVFDFRSICWQKGNDGTHFDVDLNDDGDATICLLPKYHEGPCGFEGVNYHTPQEHALMAAVRTDERALRAL